MADQTRPGKEGRSHGLYAQVDYGFKLRDAYKSAVAYPKRIKLLFQDQAAAQDDQQERALHALGAEQLHQPADDRENAQCGGKAVHPRTTEIACRVKMHDR